MSGITLSEVETSEMYWLAATNEVSVTDTLVVDNAGSHALNYADVKITDGYEDGDTLVCNTVVSGNVTSRQPLASSDYTETMHRIVTFGDPGTNYAAPPMISLQNFNTSTSVVYFKFNFSTTKFPVHPDITLSSVTWRTYIRKDLIVAPSNESPLYVDRVDATYDAADHIGQPYGTGPSATNLATFTLLISNKDGESGFSRWWYKTLTATTGQAFCNAVQEDLRDPDNAKGFMLRVEPPTMVLDVMTGGGNGFTDDLELTFEARADFYNQMLRVYSASNALAWQTLLRAVTYTHSTSSPSTWPKTVTIQLFADTESQESNVASRVMDLQEPTLDSLEAKNLTFSVGNTNLGLTSQITVADPDSQLNQATVTLDPYMENEDVLALQGTSGLTVTSNANGVLVLSGTDTPANYQAALRQLVYNNLASAPSTVTRTVSFQVRDTDGQFSNTATRYLTVAQLASSTSTGTLVPGSSGGLPPSQGFTTGEMMTLAACGVVVLGFAVGLSVLLRK